MLDEIIAIFKEKQWPFDVLTQHRALRLPFSGRNGNFVVVVEAQDELARCMVYTIWPEPVPASLRAEVMEFITRVNYGLAIGNFELDLFDGELRFKTSLDVTDTQISAALLERLITLSTYTLDFYAPGLVAVIQKGTTPMEALALIASGPKQF